MFWASGRSLIEFFFGVFHGCIFRRSATGVQVAKLPKVNASDSDQLATGWCVSIQYVQCMNNATNTDANNCLGLHISHLLAICNTFNTCY